MVSPPLQMGPGPIKWGNISLCRSIPQNLGDVLIHICRHVARRRFRLFPAIPSQIGVIPAGGAPQFKPVVEGIRVYRSPRRPPR